MPRLFMKSMGVRRLFLRGSLPIIRTFAPIVAGIVQMEKKKFMLL